MSEILSTIRKILWEDWDPIGVNGFGPNDEYDSYAPHILSMLKTGKNANQIAEHLIRLASNDIGLSGLGNEQARSEHALSVARKLVLAFGEVK